MFCKSCGHNNLEEAKFCLNCGAAMGGDEGHGIETGGSAGSTGTPVPQGSEDHPGPITGQPPAPGSEYHSPPPAPRAAESSPPAAKPRGGPKLGLILGCTCGAIALLCIALLVGIFLFGKQVMDKNNLKGLLSPTPVPSQTAGSSEIFQPDSKYVKATMCKNLAKGQKPGKPCETFSPDERLFCSVELSDMEEGDKVTGKWYKGDEFLKEVTVDIKTAGPNYVGFTLSHKKPWDTGDDYCLEIYINDIIRGKITFNVSEDTSSSPSGFDRHWRGFLKGATLCKSVDSDYSPVNPTESFDCGDKFFCSVEVEHIPPATKVLGKWYHGSDLIDEKGVPLKDGGDGYIGLSCSYPGKEWPEGDYRVEIYFDDHLVEVKKFAVSRVEE
jgi:hypothetical protein